jgi:hypothetical protein
VELGAWAGGVYPVEAAVAHAAGTIKASPPASNGGQLTASDGPGTLYPWPPDTR